MSWRVWYVRRLPCRELLSQRWDDFLAEQVELLENRLERKAGMVDKEELALIVADVLAERQGSVDHLLRRPHSRAEFGP